MKKSPPLPVSVMKADLGDRVDSPVPAKRPGQDPTGLVVRNKINGNGGGEALDHHSIKTQRRPENKSMFFLRLRVKMLLRMQQVVKTLDQTRIPYFVKGESPTLLIHAGTHGDDRGVIDSVRLAVEKYEDRLPDFVYVPEVSPAVKTRRKRNDRGWVNLNRGFSDDSPIKEAEIVKDCASFDLCVAFHEDIGLNAKFYMYDGGVGFSLEEKDSWMKFREGLEVLGVGLLSGADDQDGSTPNYTFNEDYHYHYWNVSVGSHEGGSFDAWASRNRVIQKALIPEVPGHLSQESKNKIVDLFFRYFLLKA